MGACAGSPQCESPSVRGQLWEHQGWLHVPGCPCAAVTLACGQGGDKAFVV